jgi:hypothetical protein
MGVLVHRPRTVNSSGASPNIIGDGKFPIVMSCILAVMFIMFTVFLSCAPRSENLPQVSSIVQQSKVDLVIGYNRTPRGISIVVIDGCQYVYVETSSGVAIVHKQNCNNSLHSILGK